MRFRTEITVPRQDIPVDYTHQGILVGSCFAESIGSRLLAAKLPVSVNPCGIAFNPATVCSSLEIVARARPYGPDDLQNDGEGLWFSWDHHGSFSGYDRDGVLNGINSAIASARERLAGASWAVLTFGTAWVYRLHDGRIVSNCHRRPAGEFTRDRLSVEDIIASVSSLLMPGGALEGKRVILTVSPVRHVRDGLQENSVSKAVLRLACDELCRLWPNVTYFPAFEILMDDLRDYRFYGPDLSHPSQQAVEYVWEKFSEAFIPDSVRSLMDRVARLESAFGHRIMRPGSPQGQAFMAAGAALCRELMQDIPGADFSAEASYFGV